MNFNDGSFFTTESISPRMEKTPEGFCYAEQSRSRVWAYSTTARRKQV